MGISATGLRASVARGALTMLLAAPFAALAQSEDALLANDFYRDMAPLITFSAGSSTIGVVEGRAAAGYYRVVVKRVAVNPPASESEGCRAALERFGSSRFLNVIFNRKYDAGLAVSVPLALELGQADAKVDEKSRAEINLFRIRREGDRKCRFDISIFDKEGVPEYAAPWIPIEHALVASDQQAVIRFRPWVTRESNRARVDAFFGGLGKLVNLLGPIGTIFTGTDDKYAIKGQGQASLFSSIANVGVTEGPEKTMRIVVNPSSGTKHTPQAAKFEWVLQSNDRDRPFNFTLSYSIEIQYRVSQLLPESASEFPTLKDQDQEYFRSLIRQSSPKNEPWSKLSPAVSNLFDQPSVDKFEAACQPVYSDLKTLGFSREDRALLIYAMARDKFSEGEVSRIACLTGPDGAPWLGKFAIDIPPMIPPTEKADWEAVLKASERALRQPSQVEAQSENFARFLDDRVAISGDPALLPDGEGKPLFAISASKPTYFDRGIFLSTLSKMKPANNAGCFTPFSARAESSRPEFGFPGSSGLQADEAAVALLFRTQEGEARLLVIGLRGKKAGVPVVNKLWVGDAIDDEDVDLKAIRADMLKNPRCTGVAAFKSFLTPPQSPAPQNTDAGPRPGEAVPRQEPTSNGKAPAEVSTQDATKTD